MIRVCDTDKPCLHLVYEMWDVMIEKVKKVIYEHENIDESETSTFYDMVHKILVARLAKSNTRLHCLAHSLNPRYYSHEWLTEDATRVPPHRDAEISMEQRKCFKKLFPNQDDYNKVTNEYVSFSLEGGDFGDSDALQMSHRLISRKNSEYLDEKTKMWDVGGSADVLGSLEETDIHQFVDFSLDEPEMERVFFEDSQENALWVFCAF
ncbi:hypothetical protein QQ045_019164 [Rhodiola kirilowii]